MRKRVWLVALTAGLICFTLAGAYHEAGAAPTVAHALSSLVPGTTGGSKVHMDVGAAPAR